MKKSMNHDLNHPLKMVPNWCALPKFNIAPEKLASQKENSNHPLAGASCYILLNFTGAYIMDVYISPPTVCCYWDTSYRHCYWEGGLPPIINIILPLQLMVLVEAICTLGRPNWPSPHFVGEIWSKIIICHPHPKSWHRYCMCVYTSNYYIPGDSKWPFHPLLGGHLTP